MMFDFSFLVCWGCLGARGVWFVLGVMQTFLVSGWKEEFLGLIMAAWSGIKCKADTSTDSTP